MQDAHDGDEQKRWWEEVLRKKVMHTIDTLDGHKKISKRNEMIPYITDMHVSDVKSFDSTDAAKHILDYASGSDY